VAKDDEVDVDGDPVVVFDMGDRSDNSAAAETEPARVKHRPLRVSIAIEDEGVEVIAAAAAAAADPEDAVVEVDADADDVVDDLSLNDR
jgi:hypothetical protein